MLTRTLFTGSRIARRTARAGRVVVCLLGLCAVGTAAGTERQPLEDIREAALDHARAALPEGSPSTLEVGRLDPRLRQPRCGDALETFDPPGRGSGRRATVGIRCHAPSPWTLYVSVRIETIRSIYAAGRTVPRGQRLREEDLVLVERDVERLSRGYFTSAEQVVGMEAERTLRAGDILTAARVGAPQLVERGQVVSIHAGSVATQISMNGEALQSGALGERIRVRNSSSARVVEGVIVADGRVEVRR